MKPPTLWFDGEGRASILPDGPEAVQGAGALTGSREPLLAVCERNQGPSSAGGWTAAIRAGPGHGSVLGLVPRRAYQNKSPGWQRACPTLLVVSTCSALSAAPWTLRLDPL